MRVISLSFHATILLSRILSAPALALARDSDDEASIEAEGTVAGSATDEIEGASVPT